jgi:hypothetical protein
MIGNLVAIGTPAISGYDFARSEAAGNLSTSTELSPAMQTNPNPQVSKILAYAVAAACMLTVAYIVFGYPGIEPAALRP